MLPCSPILRWQRKMPFSSCTLGQTHPLCPATETRQGQSGLAMLPLPVSSVGTRGRLPRARRCRNCAWGRAASGGALSMPSSAERGPRPPVASPPPCESSPGGSKRAGYCLNSGAPGFESCHEREEGGGARQPQSTRFITRIGRK